MQDSELFLSLAEIAGVFVGFGALIAVGAVAPTTPVLSPAFAGWCRSRCGWSSPRSPPSSSAAMTLTLTGSGDVLDFVRQRPATPPERGAEQPASLEVPAASSEQAAAPAPVGTGAG